MSACRRRARADRRALDTLTRGLSRAAIKKSPIACNKSTASSNQYSEGRGGLREDHSMRTSPRLVTSAATTRGRTNSPSSFGEHPML
jgi:hypothetical protein